MTQLKMMSRKWCKTLKDSTGFDHSQQIKESRNIVRQIIDKDNKKSKKNHFQRLFNYS